jgi:hypothetical protein
VLEAQIVLMVSPGAPTPSAAHLTNATATNPSAVVNGEMTIPVLDEQIDLARLLAHQEPRPWLIGQASGPTTLPMTTTGETAPTADGRPFAELLGHGANFALDSNVHCTSSTGASCGPNRLLNRRRCN